MKMKKVLGIIILMMTILIPFNVEAKDYKIMLSYFSNGGTVASGNVEIISGVVFEKNSTKADITYSSTQTINHINSLDGTSTFVLKKENNAQTKTREWYALNYINGKKVYFNNAKKYTVKEMVKMLNIDTSYNEEKGTPLEIYMQANYDKFISVQSVEMNISIMKIKTGKTGTLKAIVYPTNATDKSVTWSSEDSSIVTVDSKGNIKAIKDGITKIVATTNDGKKVAKCKVTVNSSKEIKATKVSIINYPKELIVGDSKTLTVKVSPSNATNKKVIWSSSNTKIATIDKTGNVKALKEGTVKITAKVNENVKETIKIKVTKEQEKKYYTRINYHINGGSLSTMRGKSIKETNGLIYKGNKKLYTNIKYGQKTNNYGLIDTNNAFNCVNIIRSGYYIKLGSEWNTKPNGKGKSYSQSKVYTASDFCDSSKKDCVVTLYANWKKINFKRVDSLAVPATVKNTVGYSTVQSIVYTGKYFIFVMTNPNNDLGLYVMKKNNNNWVHYKTVSKIGTGHGQDVAYVPKENAIAFIIGKEVMYIDADTFKERKDLKATLTHSYSCLAYDRDNDRYIVGAGNRQEGKFYYTVCKSTISNKTCKTRSFSSKRTMTGQGCEVHNGVFYKVNFDAGHANKYQEVSPIGKRGGEIDIYDSQYNKKGNVRFTADSILSDGLDLGEVEGIDFIDDTPYVLFTGDRKFGSISAIGRVYIPQY